MLRKCTGTRNKDGCGGDKLIKEFSKSNRNMCKECERRHKRNKYHNIEHPSPEDEKRKAKSKARDGRASLPFAARRVMKGPSSTTYSPTRKQHPPS